MDLSTCDWNWVCRFLKSRLFPEQVKLFFLAQSFVKCISVCYVRDDCRTVHKYVLTMTKKYGNGGPTLFDIRLLGFLGNMYSNVWLIRPDPRDR